MPYSFNFGGTSTNRSSYVYGVPHGVKSEYGGFPVGNVNDSGSRPVKIYGLSVMGLSGGYPQIWFGGSSQGAGGVWNSSGGMFAIRCISTSSPMYFGRLNDNGVNTIDEADGSVWSPRGGLCGYFDWATVPPAPTFNSATPGSGSGTVNISFSSNGDGGEGVDQWQVNYATNASFSGGGLFDSSGTSTFTGTPGVTYYFRARGRNDVGWGTWSNTRSATTVGVPSAVQSLTAGVSTTAPNTINLSWNAPATPGGTITGYKIYRDGVLAHTTSGTGTTYNMGGLTRGQSYSFVVRARNSYSDSIGSEGAASNTASQTAQGVPSAPQNVTAVADALNPGEIDVDWDAPSYSGVGGITGYDVYLSTGTQIASGLAAGTTAYTATGLTPGTTYGFVIRARNAVATASATLGDASATAYETALGDPPQVTGVAVAADAKVSGRLVITWTDPNIGVAAVVGYSVFNATTNALLGKVTSEKFVVDGLTPGTTYSYYVRARNTVTEQAGSDGGPQSVTVSGSPGATANQPTGTLSNAVTNNTNGVLAGNKVLTGVTGNTFTYSYFGGTVALVNSGGSAEDTTNVTLNGTVTITVTSPTTFTYAKTAPNLSTTTTSGGDALNNTNNAYNGTFTVSAADSFDQTVSYALVGPDLAETAATGTVTNNTNAVFNGDNFTITAATSNTFSYARTASNVTEISATGTATDATNRDIYNGTYVVSEVPTYDSFTYSRF